MVDVLVIEVVVVAVVVVELVVCCKEGTATAKSARSSSRRIFVLKTLFFCKSLDENVEAWVYVSTVKLN